MIFRIRAPLSAHLHNHAVKCRFDSIRQRPAQLLIVEIDQVLHGPSEAVKFPHNEGVALAEQVEGLVKAGTMPGGAGSSCR